MSDVKMHCSFCAKSQDEVETLIAGPLGNICDECVDLSVDIVAENRKKRRVVLAERAQLADIQANGT